MKYVLILIFIFSNLCFAGDKSLYRKNIDKYNLLWEKDMRRVLYHVRGGCDITVEDILDMINAGVVNEALLIDKKWIEIYELERNK